MNLKWCRKVMTEFPACCHIIKPTRRYVPSFISKALSSIITIAAGNSAFYKIMTKDFKGYVPLTKTWNKPLTTDTLNRMEVLDSNKINIFTSFIQDCIDSGIKLYIVSPPLYIRSMYPKQSMLLGKKIAAEHNIEFLDYTNDSTFLANPSYYTDFIHFNDEGAKVFTDILVRDILEKNSREGKNKTPVLGITP
jgi:predicted peroxiredoxin